MKRLAVFFALALFLLAPTSLSAAECQFVLGFKTLRDLVGHDVVGDCLESEHYNATGDSVQQTTGGLLVWRKADNWTAFTDGYRTWINGPNGLEQRLNTERFPWEVEQTFASLSWLQDGLDNDLERLAYDLLRKWAVASPVLFAEIADKSLVRSHSLQVEGVSTWWLLQHIDAMVERDVATALRIVRMPFMRPISYGAEGAWSALLDIYDSDRSGFQELLAHPKLRDGIRSDQFVMIPLLYLEPINPEAAAAIGKLPWIYNSPWMADHFRRLFFVSEPVFWAVLKQIRDHQLPWTTLRSTISLAEIDEATALRIVGMPFFWTQVRGADHVVFEYANQLAREDLAGLQQILSHPEFHGGITDDHITTFVLHVLGREHPDAAAAIAALPWVQDGVTARPISNYVGFSNDPRVVEESAVLMLAGIAAKSREVLFELVRKPWLRDGVTNDEEQVILKLDWMVDGDVASVLQLLGMPFLNSPTAGDESRILDVLNEVLWHTPNGQQGLRKLLAHPSLRGGITDDQRAIVELLAIGIRSPEVGAAIDKLWWVQDGIDASEQSAVTLLHGVSHSSHKLLPAFVQKSWVRDGISQYEREVIWILNSIAKSPPDPAEATVLAIIAMPFLENFGDAAEVLAVRSLILLHEAPEGSYLRQVLSHPWLRGGIKDSQTRVIALLGASPERAMALLDRQP